MACCAGQSLIRSQVIAPKTVERKPQAQVLRINQSPSSIPIRKHTALTNCKQCGFPTLQVNTSTKTRIQCSNPECRLIQ